MKMKIAEEGGKLDLGLKFVSILPPHYYYFFFASTSFPIDSFVPIAFLYDYFDFILCHGVQFNLRNDILDTQKIIFPGRKF